MIRKALWLSATSVFLTLFTIGGHAEDRVVNVYNWSDYIDSSIIDEFHQGNRHQGRLRHLRFQRDPGNQAACRRQRLRRRRAQRQFPARQIQAGVFQKLDKSKLPNLSNMWDVMSERTAKYDPGNEYAVNYMWGTVGIGYNVKKVQASARHRQDRQLGRVLQAGESRQVEGLRHLRARFAGRRDAGGVELSRSRPEQHRRRTISTRPRRLCSRSGPTSASSIPPNTSTPWPTATSAWRSAIRATSSRRATAPTRPRRASRSAIPCPRKGAQMWFDLMAIPADAPHVAEAHEFINYMMKPEVIAKSTNYVFYANGNKASQQFVDKAILDDPAIYPTRRRVQKLYHRRALRSQDPAHRHAQLDQDRHRPVSKTERPRRKPAGVITFQAASAEAGAGHEIAWQHPQGFRAMERSDAKPFIQFENVTKKFGDFTAVNNLSLDIYRARVLRAARRVRLRQVDAAAHARRLRGADRRPHRARRPGPAPACRPTGGRST